MSRTLMAWCPDWPVIAAARAAGVDPDGPVAVLRAGRVYACSDAARKAGVRRDLRRREAEARCQRIVVLDYDPAVDARHFEPVVAALEELAPGVEVVRPGMAAVATRGPSRYFGGEEVFAQRVIDHLEVAGYPAVVGIADGPFAAEAAARMHTVFPPGASGRCLAPLPIETLERPELADLLRRLGIRTLGAFAALPASRVLERFGHDGALAHRLAAGREERPLAARRPPPDLATETALETPVERVDQVVFAVRESADRLVADLAARDLVCTSLRVEVGCDDGSEFEREWRHPRWFSAADVVDRVRWQLQAGSVGDRAPSPLGAGVVRVRLAPAEVDRPGVFATGLWDEAGPSEHVHRAVGRVQSMLGHDGVVTPMVVGGRAPADRVAYVPWGDAPAAHDGAPVGSRPGPSRSPSSRSGSPRSASARPAPSRSAGAGAGRRAAGRVVDRSGAGSGGPTGGAGTGGASNDPGRGDGVGAWPGSLPSPRPSRVFAEPRPLDLADLPDVVGWAGPWPVRERWWDPERAREYDRYQVTCTDSSTYLLLRENGRWYLEASYD